MLEKVIRQLPDEKFNHLKNDLTANKGEKLIYLLNKYRSDEQNDDEIIAELQLNSSSFYTLRSRLMDKVQTFLFHHSEFEGAELLKNVYSIPHVLYNYPRETAITLLTHLENELIRLDMQSELIAVYNGLKKLHLNSDKYFFYEQCYNKTVAFTLSQDKAEESLSLFCKSLSAYLLARTDALKEIMLLYLQEIHNLTLLYESARLNLYHKIAYLNFVIFVDSNYAEYYQKSTEDLLKDCQHTLSTIHKNDFSAHLETALQYLYFQYHHSLKQHKRNLELSQQLAAHPTHVLNLYTITCPDRFPISLLEMGLSEKPAFDLVKNYLNEISPQDPANETGFINYYLAKAGIFYEEEKLNDCQQALQQLMNCAFLKKYPFIETEIKLFYIYILLLVEKYDLAENLLRSITRKNDPQHHSDQAAQFVSLLKIALSVSSQTKQKKLFDAFRIFKLIAPSGNPLLPYLHVKEKHILQLSMI